MNALSAAADNGKQDDELYLNRGYVYLGLNQPIKARQQFQLALAENPDYFFAHLEMARLLAEERDHEQAVREYRSAVASQPDNFLASVD